MATLALLLAAAALAAPAPPAGSPPPVILVTIDGVRPREVFGGPDQVASGRASGEAGSGLLPRLRERAARAGFLAGDPALADPFPVKNGAACSLPGYQAILAGLDTGCRDNRCGRIQVETLLERVRRELGLAEGEVAVFASWPEIALAVERVPGRLTVDAGRSDHPAPWGYRGDQETWDLAMRHLERARPRVLYVALGDPDEWAHLGDGPAYAAAVAALDERLEALFLRLEAMGDYGAGASVLVTTDHGRGDGPDWTSHGVGHPGSRQAWLFASTPATRRAPGRAGRGRYDHLSIRPTIEALLGLGPCPDCRPPMLELLPGPAVALAGGGDAVGGP